MCYDGLMQSAPKTALVTGAAKRVGREIALVLANNGWDVLVHYRSSSKDAEGTAADIRALGRKAALLQADLASAADVARLAKEAWAAGPVGLLVNSASLYYKTPPETVSEKDWDSLVDTNLKAPFLLSFELCRRMASGSGGQVVNVADWSGFRPYKDFAPYCASKGGLITLTKSLARDFAPSVRSNAVAPGPVLPPPDMGADERARVASTTALGRWGSPADVANAVRFLAENHFVNGTVLVVDGGRSIA